MGWRQFEICAWTLRYIALGLFLVVLAEAKPEGSCYLDNEMKNGLICTSDVKTDSTKFYVTEQTFCSHRTKDLCMTCIDGTLVKMKCNRRPRRRPKRSWFWGVSRSVDLCDIIHSKICHPFIAPSIFCPSVPSTVIAPANSNTAVVTWTMPTGFNDDASKPEIKLTTGKTSGSKFEEGTHAVSYTAYDPRGMSSTCSFSFTVEVIRCPLPPSVSNGKFQCASTIGTVYGTKCTYTCNSGYEISGSANITCQSNGNFTSSPICKKISCDDPTIPMNGKSLTCTEGHLYQSVCLPVCEQGYIPGNGARLYCSASRKWHPSSWTCVDKVEPKFTNCPEKKINTIDRNFRWTVTATDNTGKVTVEQVQGNPPGTTMEYGVHIIKYVATDPTGNKAFCDFVVELKATDCPIPTSNDKDIKFTCDGMTATSVCQLYCASKARVEGSKYISCVRDETGNNTSHWEPMKGNTASCYRASCPLLKPPKNGALACDKQLGGSSCQIQCNKDFDVAVSEQSFSSFVCTDDGEWHPRGTVPDCLEMSFPDEYYLPTDFYYYTGDCSDPETLNGIKQQFVNNLNSIRLSACLNDECSMDDIKVTCGDLVEPTGFVFRRKRSSTGLHLSMKIRVKNPNRTMSHHAAGTLLLSVVEKYKRILPQNITIRHSVQAIDEDPTLLTNMKVISVTGNMTMTCGSGYSQVQPGRCVPCSIGSYADKGTCKTCPQNTYQNKSGSTSCEPCPAHHTTLSTGAVSKDECQELCNIDEFSLTGRAPCFPCPDDKHQPQIGSTTCLPCPGFHIVGPVSLKCLYRTFKPKNDAVVPNQFRVSRYQLTCEEEICLKF